MKKILILHGWNWRNYTRFGVEQPWSNRSEFFQKLQEHFVVIAPAFPGFCGSPEPEKPWNLDDYAKFVDEIVQTEKPDVILGYSFGAAVALHWKYLLKNTLTPIVLVSPAITRKYSVKNIHLDFMKQILPNKIIWILRDWYLRFVIKNSYYLSGTYFLKQSYLNIVRVNLQPELETIGPKQVVLIFGENDTATPPMVLLEQLTENSPLRDRCVVIPGGTHDIANSHADEIIHHIVEFLKSHQK